MAMSFMIYDEWRSNIFPIRIDFQLIGESESEFFEIFTIFWKIVLLGDFFKNIKLRSSINWQILKCRKLQRIKDIKNEKENTKNHKNAIVWI